MRNLSFVFVIFALSAGCASCFSPGTFLRQAINKSPKEASAPSSNENGRDPEYPWCFTGRLWFRPALVRVPSSSDPSDPAPPPSVSILNAFGWTIGGTVALEYDESPVGPYREYVTMGAVVSKRGALGQWGSRLYVSTKVAEDVCQDIWNVPAELADIDFVEDQETSAPLSVESAPDKTITGAKQKIAVRGWANTRVLGAEEADSPRNPKGGLSVLWTPSIKALWAPLVPLPGSGDDDTKLPLHKLRLSASALRLTLCGQPPSDALGIPIGIGLLVDNVLIEISRKDSDL